MHSKINLLAARRASRMNAFRCTALLMGLVLVGSCGPASSIDSRLAEQLIRKDLAYHPPTYEVALSAATSGRALTALERAGIVEYVSRYRTCSGKYETVRQTERGAAFASANMWPFVYGSLMVPLGRFVYVPHSQRLNLRNGVPVSLTFRFTFLGNNNVRRLAMIGAASIWHIRSPDGTSLTAADAGRAFTTTVTLKRPQMATDEWKIDEGPRSKCLSDAETPASTPSTNSVTPTPLPSFGPADVPAMTLANLNYNTPRVTLNLNCGLPSRETHSLERAGILQRDGTARGCGPDGPASRYAVTERGLQIVATRGWLLGPGYLSIPAGRLVYRTNSFSVEEERSHPEWLTYSFRFEGNANYAYLVSIAPAKKWCITAFPPPPILSLADVGHVRARRVLMVRDPDARWVLLNQWLAPSPSC